MLSKTRQLITLLIVLFAMAGCRKELYVNLSQQDANAMTVALLEEGVRVDKESVDGGKTWVLSVDEGELVHAMKILKERSLPATQYASLGELFKKEGIISTPTEERVRFIYGIEQELSATLSRIDGIVDARVQIVLPDNDPLASAAKPSSASVFIKYRANVNVPALVPQIRSLVTHSVEGLQFDAVSVICVPSATQNTKQMSTQSTFMGGKWPWLIMSVLGVAVLTIAAFFAVRYRGRLKGGLPMVGGQLSD
ncbi:type III secretion associated protein [Caballeronia calidae]|uniref:Lipoprotein n=1 Tax=Caballeronia calidae TaxID=1777139 RepID=A0A158EG19_9BURK|nr:type III secretion inner membrane ring lipoprotein SctJ [Caballeronia calidae]SAL05832.1 type III secretion associated protein [Caballeronia calidae]